MLGLGPGRGSDFGNLVIGQMWEAGEDVAQVRVRIDVSAATTFDDGEDDRAGLAGTRFADEEPVFLSDGGGSNGVFHEVIVYFDASVSQVNFERTPLAQGVIDSLTEQALRQMAAA